MTTSVSVQQDTTVLTVTGEVDLATAPTLQTAIENALAAHTATLVLDLSPVTFLASAGMAALVTAKKLAGETTRVAVVADGPATSRQLKLTNLDQVFELYKTLGEALQALRPGAS